MLTQRWLNIDINMSNNAVSFLFYKKPLKKLICSTANLSRHLGMKHMSSDSLPFNEKYSPSIAKVSSGEVRKAEWEKSVKNPTEFWAEKAKAIDWFKAPTHSAG